MQRISVVGTTGTGKTSLATALADLLDAEHIELDAIHWKPGWEAAEPEEIRAALDTALQAERWVACGG